MSCFIRAQAKLPRKLIHLNSNEDASEENEHISNSVQLILDTDGDICGTVALLACEIEDQVVDGTQIYKAHQISANLGSSQLPNNSR